MFRASRFRIRLIPFHPQKDNYPFLHGCWRVTNCCLPELYALVDSIGTDPARIISRSLSPIRHCHPHSNCEIKGLGKGAGGSRISPQPRFYSGPTAGGRDYDMALVAGSRCPCRGSSIHCWPGLRTLREWRGILWRDSQHKDSPSSPRTTFFLDHDSTFQHGYWGNPGSLCHASSLFGCGPGTRARVG